MKRGEEPLSMNRFPDRKRPRYDTVPTEQDWGEYWRDLDQNSAHEKFFGRTNEEMQPHFHRNLYSYAEELHYIPEIPFRYYLRGLRDFVLAIDVDDHNAPRAADSFLSIVHRRLEIYPRHIMPIMPELLPAIEHVAQNQVAFSAYKPIYGSFVDQQKRIQDLYE